MQSKTPIKKATINASIKKAPIKKAPIKKASIKKASIKKALSAIALPWIPKSSIQKDQKFYVRYKNVTQKKDSYLNPMRIIKIISPTHFNKLYKKGEIIRANDLSDLEKSNFPKVFYLNKLEILDECFKNFSEGIPPPTK